MKWLFELISKLFSSKAPEDNLNEETVKESIEIKVIPRAQTSDSTVSWIYVDDIPFGVLLEDGYRKIKEYGHTRIPGGKYKVIRKKDGPKFYEKYKKKYSSRSEPYKGQFILEIMDVPGFTAILIHIGNTPWAMRKKPYGESLGCPLINLDMRIHHETKNYYGSQSEIAFLEFMDYICGFPEDVPINIDIERDDHPHVVV